MTAQHFTSSGEFFPRANTHIFRTADSNGILRLADEVSREIVQTINSTNDWIGSADLSLFQCWHKQIYESLIFIINSIFVFECLTFAFGRDDFDLCWASSGGEELKRDFNVRRNAEARSNAILIYALEKCLLSSGRE